LILSFGWLPPSILARPAPSRAWATQAKALDLDGSHADQISEPFAAFFLSHQLVQEMIGENRMLDLGSQLGCFLAVIDRDREDLPVDLVGP
jgi:hypothetical protein